MNETIEIVSLKLVKDGDLRTQYNTKLNSAANAYNVVNSLIGDRDREHSVVITLDTQLQINSISIVSIGSVNQAIVHPREVFKSAILHNASSIIIAHNHPSGILEPSSADISITARLKEAGEILGIELLDHLIVNESRYYSFKENGIL